MSIGEKILELRKKSNFSQEKLAEKVGITRQTLSNWESDITSPDLVQANKLCKIFKISINELVDENVEFYMKDNSQDLFSNLLGKTVMLDFEDEENDTYNDKIYESGKKKKLNLKVVISREIKYYKVLDINEDFIKVEYEERDKTVQKLIDLDLILSIIVVDEEVC